MVRGGGKGKVRAGKLLPSLQTQMRTRESGRRKLGNGIGLGMADIMPDLSSHSGTQVLFSDVSVNLYFSVDFTPVLKWAAC